MTEQFCLKNLFLLEFCETIFFILTKTIAFPHVSNGSPLTRVNTKHSDKNSLEIFAFIFTSFLTVVNNAFMVTLTGLITTMTSILL